MADIKDGQYRDPVSGATVTVKGGKVLLERGGELFSQDPNLAGQDILSGGFKPATQTQLAEHENEKKYGSVSEGAKALVEHAATGVYGGFTAVPRALGAVAESLYKSAGAPMSGPGVAALSEEALAKGVATGIGGVKAGEEYAAARSGRAQAHPAAAFGGELIGQTVGAVGAPLAGAAAQGANLATKTAASALEGAGFGGAAVTEGSYLHNSDITGEKLVAAMGPMAILGAGASLLGAGASRLFSREGSRAGAPIGSPYLTAGTESGPTGFRKMLSEFAEERTTKALGARGADIRKMGRTAEAAEANMRKMSRDVLEGTLDDGTKVFKPLQSQDELVANVLRARDEAAEHLQTFRERVWKHAEESGGYRKNANLVDMDGFYKTVEKNVIDPLRKSGVAEARAKAGELSSRLDEIRALGENPSLPELTKYRQQLRDVFQPPRPVGGGLAPPVPASAVELEQLERLLEKTIENATDKAAASLPGAKAAEYVTLKSKFRSFNQAAAIVGKADLQDLGNRVLSPSDYLTGLGGAVVGTVAGGGIGGAITGAISSTVHKTIREHSSAVLAVLADRLAKNVDTRIESAVGKVLALEKAPAIGPVGGKLRIAQTAGMAAFAKAGEDPREAFIRRAKEIHTASNPLQATAKLGQSLGPLYSHAPQAGTAATATTQRAVQYLASKIPAGSMSVNALSPAKPDTNISDEDLHKFATAWTTVNNPLSILDDLQKNMLTSEQVEAVKVVYPQLFTQIQFKVREALTKLKEPPSYSTRLQLDLLLDLNGAGEPSLTPEFQRTLAGLNQALQQQAKQGRPRPSGGSKPMATPRSLSSSLAVEG